MEYFNWKDYKKGIIVIDPHTLPVNDNTWLKKKDRKRYEAKNPGARRYKNSVILK